MFSNALCFLQEQLALERKMSVSVKLVYNFTLKQGIYKEWQKTKTETFSSLSTLPLRYLLLHLSELLILLPHGNVRWLPPVSDKQHQRNNSSLYLKTQWDWGFLLIFRLCLFVLHHCRSFTLQVLFSRYLLLFPCLSCFLKQTFKLYIYSILYCKVPLVKTRAPLLCCNCYVVLKLIVTDIKVFTTDRKCRPKQ